jgi:hypothetical protein
MKQIGEIAKLVLVEKCSEQAQASSKDGKRISYPLWLRDIFTMFAAIYGQLWLNQFIDEEMTEVIKRTWWMLLKDFEQIEINVAAEEVYKKFAYPPKPAQMLEILKFNRNRRKDNETFRILDEKRLLPMPQKAPDSLEVLEAKAKMWDNLGLILRATKVRDEIQARIAECEKQ